jgi:predicted helicase
MNIEHEYYEKMGQYEPFEGLCFADTLELAEGQQLSLFVEENTERVQREKDAQIMVVIGNPPYNAWQKSENDNNKNRPYLIIDEHVRKTYVKDSKATLKNSLYDAYVRFFRWAADRLQGNDGIVCFVSNNSFIDQFAFDGMRKHLMKDFTQIYHLDLHGNVRKNPKLSGTTHNVFGIQVGVGITIAIKNSKNPNQNIRYYRVPEYWRKSEKLAFLREKADVAGIDWIELLPDENYAWITEGLHPEFVRFPLMGIKRADVPIGTDNPVLFKLYSGGVKTNRDTWVYDFNQTTLQEKMEKFIGMYNSEIDKWKRRGNSSTTIDNFVIYDDRRIKWSEHLKNQLASEKYIAYSVSNIRSSTYRPFTKQFLYFDSVVNDRRLLQYLFFPSLASEKENSVICLSGVSSNKPFHCLVTNIIPCFDLLEKTQCFPFYTYAEDGSNRRENITDWALKQFQDRYGSDVSKWDMFHYVYGLLHHPQYRERYKENLKRDLPHIPLLRQREKFLTCMQIGKQLMELHLNYEQAKEYPLKWDENKSVPFSWRVEKMKFTSDKRAVVVNERLTLAGIPQECFEYRLGNRSALEWVVDQYQVTQDKRSGIESDPNRLDDEEYIVRLVGRVVTVSVETVKLVNELAREVTVEDWLEDTEITKPL